LNAAIVWPLVVIFLAWCVLLAAWLWASQRLERHMRTNHPVIAGSLYPPVRGLTVAPADEERIIEIDGHARFRLREFLASGGARKLNDSVLDRLLRVRRLLEWMMHVCLAVFVPLVGFAVYRT
jgi:hypothetical protein